MEMNSIAVAIAADMALPATMHCFIPWMLRTEMDPHLVQIKHPVQAKGNRNLLSRRR